MRKLGTSIAFLALAGCASTNYSDFVMGEAFISKLEINEIHNLKRGKHKLKISFAYEISEYVGVGGAGLYNCSVQFLTLNGTTTTTVITRGRHLPCELDNAKGEISITWPTILDKTFSPSKEQLAQIKYPMEYYVAIHQRTGENTSKIIGKSPIQVSSVKI